MRRVRGGCPLSRCVAGWPLGENEVIFTCRARATRSASSHPNVSTRPCSSPWTLISLAFHRFKRFISCTSRNTILQLTNWPQSSLPPQLLLSALVPGRLAGRPALSDAKLGLAESARERVSGVSRMRGVQLTCTMLATASPVAI